MGTRRWIFYLICALFMLGLILSYQNYSEKLTGFFSSDQAAPESEPVTLRLVAYLNPEIKLTDNAVIKRIEQLTHIKLEVEAPPLSSYQQRLKVIVDSGDLPDLFWGGTDVDFERWSREGILAKLDDKVKAYPNLMANISEQQWADARALADGEIHAIPRPNSHDRWGYLINRKWLDRLQLKAPTTIDEFVKVARAFTLNDPDGNGKMDTQGVSFSSKGIRRDFFTTAFNFSGHWGIPAKDGKFYTRFTNPEYIAMVTLMRDMYKEGILDREFTAYNSMEDVGKFAKNKVGIIGMSDRGVTEFIRQNHLSAEDYTFHAPLKPNAQGESIYMMPPSNWGAFLIPASTSKLDDVLRFMDWANTEEAFELFHFGIKGIHYNSYDIENRIVDRTPAQLNELAPVTSRYFSFALAYKGKPDIIGGDTQKERDKFNAESVAAARGVTEYWVPFVKQMHALENDLPNETRRLETLESKYISGDISVIELEDFINHSYKPKVQPL